MKKITLISMIVVLSIIIFNFQSFAACTCIVVGKDASADGSVFCTVGQEMYGTDTRLFFVPAQDHESGSMRRVPDYPQAYRWFDQYGNPIDADNVAVAADRHTPLENPEEVKVLEIPQVPHTYAYTYSTCAAQNEHQVGFAMATNSAPSMLWNDEGQIRNTQITMIAAERAKTAREAIQVMGEVLEKYGWRGEFTAGTGFGVIDKNEGWIFHAFGPGPFWTQDSGEPGCIWAAQRVPDDEVGVFPNGVAITEIDFDDPDNFMYSSNFESALEELGYGILKVENLLI
jgi:dipeptidase